MNVLIMSLTVHSLGTFIFQTPPLALLSSSLQTKIPQILNIFKYYKREHAFILNANLPERFSLSSHQMIAASQRQVRDAGYVVVNSPKVLLQVHGEERKWIIGLEHRIGTGRADRWAC